MTDSIFTTAYERLNPVQRQAVDTIYGPVMVIAGPGTGKTQIIALRTANILRTTDVFPDNILITTFTEAGVISIKKRLMELVGVDGNRVNVCTIHAFCNEIIQSYPEKFLAFKAGRSIDDIEQIEIYEQIFTDNTFEFLSSDYDKMFYLQTARDRIGKLKQEGTNPVAFRRIIEEEKQRYAEELSEIDPKLKKYATTQEKHEKHIGKLSDLAVVYEAYLQKCRELGVYDFSDMIRFVLEAFRLDENLRYSVSEKYQFVMIDEYQDTNNSQNEILELIVSANESKNILVVGDDDQSIYRFQGANLENMLHFSKKYPTASILVLTENYRSIQTIIDCSQETIVHNATRIVRYIPDITKTLHANREVEGCVEFFAYQNELSERASILERIRKHIVTGKDPREFAVIVRTNREVEEWTSFLQDHSIPVESKLRTNVFASRFVHLLLDLIKIVANPYSSEAGIIHILRSGLFDIDRVDVLRLNRKLYIENYTRREKKRIFDFLCGLTPDPSPEEERGEQTSLFGNKGQSQDFARLAALVEFRDFIIDSQKPLSENDFYTFFRALLDNSGFVSYIESEGTFSDLEDVYTLLEVIKSWTQSDASFDIEKMLKKISYYEKYNITMNRRILKATMNGIQVLTAHQSKGLEYDIVCMPGLGSSNWEKKRVVDQLRLPSSVVGDGFIDEENTREEEERRLFFVGLTRAKNELYFSFSMSSGDKVTLQSIFTQELSVTPKIVNDVSLEGVLTSELKKDLTLRSDITSEEELYIREFLENYKLSATDLNKFLSDPQVFLREVIFRYPFEENEFTIFGKAYHKALEIFYVTYKNTLEVPTLSWLLDQFRTLLYREILLPETRDSLLQKGTEGLTGWYDQNNGKFLIPLELELNFYNRNIFLDNVPLTGKIDKVEKVSGDELRVSGDVLGKIPVRLIDYKTGRTKSLNEIKGNTANSEGNYFRQLLFYKIMFDLDRKLSYEFDSSSLAIEFVEGKDGKYSSVDVDFTAEDIEQAKQEIRDAWNKINDMEFWRELLKK